MGEHRGSRRIPKPAHPRERREPLPWQRPKSGEEDPEAPQRLAQILANPNYRQADQDVDFLHRDDTRSVRLELDYWKAELLLQQHRISGSVVVLGSTRLPEPVQARHRLQEARAASARDPGNAELLQRVAAAVRIEEKSRYYDVARELGRLVGQAGERRGDGRLVVVTGGGPGIMEAANRGASDVGARSVGLNITLPHEQFPNPYITPDLCFRFHYFALRKLHFMLRAQAVVAFPGGYGTFDELFETLTLVQTRKMAPLPIILVGEEYWRRAFDVDFLVSEGTVDAEDRDLFWFAESAEEIWNGILRWHENNGTPLLEAR
ncbi:TIGR00730 family Rossman fold protein [bacterium]|nr:MAG: TIGR00730 family Rossman fold protein [bacterium]